MEKTVCKICIAEKGLKGEDLWNDKCDYAFEEGDEKAFMKHMRDEHNIAVKNDDGKIIN